MLSEYPQEECSKQLDGLEAIANLAKANFPRTTEVRVETCGLDPKASMTLSWSVIAFLVEVGRATLDKGRGE